MAIVDGHGSVSFNQCNFVDWDNIKHVGPALDIGWYSDGFACGSHRRNRISAWHRCGGSDFVGNQMAGKVDIQNNAHGVSLLRQRMSLWISRLL